MPSVLTPPVCLGASFAYLLCVMQLAANLQATSAGWQAGTAADTGTRGARLPSTPLQPGEHTRQLPELLQLLGLHVHGQQLLEAALKVTALTLILFLGPLHHKATTQRHQHKQLHVGAVDNVSLLHKARDYLVSPLTEEWCFRACMVPLLWLQVRCCRFCDEATAAEPGVLACDFEAWQF
jgi:hypothetical protein